MKRIVFIITILMVFTGLVSSEGVLAQKMTAEQVVEQHLAALGKESDRKNMFNVTAVGEVGFQKSTSTREPHMGKAVFATEGNKTLLAMTFPSSSYQGEQIRFDGSNLKVEFSEPGLRSILGDYLFRYDIIAKQGLLLGALLRRLGYVRPIA